jgi:hypothetical protein
VDGYLRGGAGRNNVHRHRNRRTPQPDNPIEGIFRLLMTRPQHTHERPLRPRAVFGAVAAPGFAVNHGGTQCPLGGIIGRVDAGRISESNGMLQISCGLLSVSRRVAAAHNGLYVYSRRELPRSAVFFPGEFSRASQKWYSSSLG